MFRDANGVVVPVMDLSDGYRSAKDGKLKRDTLLRLVHGTVLDAYGTEAFGSEAAATRSPRSRELHRRLAQLNNRELLKGLSPKERRDRDRLRRTLPAVPAS